MLAGVQTAARAVRYSKVYLGHKKHVQTSNLERLGQNLGAIFSNFKTYNYFVLDAIHIYREKYINLTTMLLPWNNKLTWKWIDFSVPWTSVNDFWDQIITVR